MLQFTIYPNGPIFLDTVKAVMNGKKNRALIRIVVALSDTRSIGIISAIIAKTVMVGTRNLVIIVMTPSESTVNGKIFPSTAKVATSGKKDLAQTHAAMEK